MSQIKRVVVVRTYYKHCAAHKAIIPDVFRLWNKMFKEFFMFVNYIFVQHHAIVCRKWGLGHFIVTCIAVLCFWTRLLFYPIGDDVTRDISPQILGLLLYSYQNIVSWYSHRKYVLSNVYVIQTGFQKRGVRCIFEFRWV